MNRREYIARINSVINYIQNHMDEDLSLKTLSSVAAFSPFHFHRIFKAIVGENLNEFVKRIRVEKSADFLINRDDLTITEIALICGFSSSSTFSRAFSGYFGVNARIFRKNKPNSKDCKIYRKNEQESWFPENYSNYRAVSHQVPLGGINFAVKIERLPELHVAFVRNMFGYSKGIYSKDIVAAFIKTEMWLRKNNLDPKESLELGITYDNPDITASRKCRYDAAYTLPRSFIQGEGEVGIQDVSGGLYAVSSIQLTDVKNAEEAIRELGQAVDQLYGQWLPDSGFKLANRPCLEVYHTKLQGPLVRIDYFLPIEEG
jgi:AraC family transcriptional regulator